MIGFARRAVVAAVVALTLAGCSSTGATSDGKPLPGGVPLDITKATCAEYAAASEGDQLQTSKQNLEFFRKTLDRPGVDPNGEPTNTQVRKLTDVTLGYCGAEQADETVLKVQARFVDLAPDDYLGT